MNQGIKIPLSLEVMQSSIQELQKVLGRLKVDSTSFKQIESIIIAIKKNIDSLYVQSSKPFLNQKGIDQASNSVSKIEEQFSKASLAISRIKFSDLDLGTEQLAELDKLESKITEIKNNVIEVKSTIRDELMSSDTGKMLRNIAPQVDTQNFDQIIKTVQAKTKEVANEYKKAQNELTRAENQIATSEKASRIISNPNQVIQDYLKTNGNFKNNGANLLADYLKEQFSLKEADVTQIRQSTAKEVQQLLQDVNSNIRQALAKVVQKGNVAEEKRGALKSELDRVSAEQEQMVEINRIVSESQQKINEVERNSVPAMRTAEKAVGQFQQRVEQAARSTPHAGIAAEKAAGGISKLREQLQSATAEMTKYNSQQRNIESMKFAITNFMGFTQVLNLVKQGIKAAANHIKELDTVMNRIAIVTDMATGELWNQIDAYSDMASKYGVSIKGAYEVSQIYYQQGLETADVMTLTNETLKLAKISGLDYASTTDYMTTALRGFKMEMAEASTVVDVYSALAANTAVSQQELAIAMSKTASSMESVGSTFQETSAMIGTMVAVTRESATNIGSAMKSIASRYGELTKDPTKLVDQDGEALAFNKVDAALSSVGISMKTVDGQFREFTDVIVELGEKWDQLDSVQQRYIATQFAGNRQQSRFLALVSNIDLLKANMEVAENSEDIGTVQAIKSLDSIEAKLEQVRVSYQQFYTSIGLESVWKTALDGIHNYIDTLNGLDKLFGKIPLGAIAMIMDIVSVIKGVGGKLVEAYASIWYNVFSKNKDNPVAQQAAQFADSAKNAESAMQNTINTVVDSSAQGEPRVNAAGRSLGEAYAAGFRNGLSNLANPVQNVDSPSNQAVKDEKQAEVKNQDSNKNVPVSQPENNIGNNTQEVNAATEAQNALNNSVQQTTEAYSQVQDAAQQATEAVNNYAAAQGDTAAQLKALSSFGFQAAFDEEQKFQHFDYTNIAAETENALVQLIASVANSSDQFRAVFKSVGNDAIQGFIAGLLQNYGVPAEAATKIALASVEAIRTAINSHSPSKVTMDIGNDFVEGYVIGIAEKAAEAMNSGSELAKSTLNGLKEGLDEEGFEKLKAQLISGLDEALKASRPSDMSEEDWTKNQKKLMEERKAINKTDFKSFQSGDGPAARIFQQFSEQIQSADVDWYAELLHRRSNLEEQISASDNIVQQKQQALDEAEAALQKVRDRSVEDIASEMVSNSVSLTEEQVWAAEHYDKHRLEWLRHELQGQPAIENPGEFTEEKPVFSEQPPVPEFDEARPAPMMSFEEFRKMRDREEGLIWEQGGVESNKFDVWEAAGISEQEKRNRISKAIAENPRLTTKFDIELAAMPRNEAMIEDYYNKKQQAKYRELSDQHDQTVSEIEASRNPLGRNGRLKRANEEYYAALDQLSKDIQAEKEKELQEYRSSPLGKKEAEFKAVQAKKRSKTDEEWDAQRRAEYEAETQKNVQAQQEWEQRKAEYEAQHPELATYHQRQAEHEEALTGYNDRKAAHEQQRQGYQKQQELAELEKADEIVTGQLFPLFKQRKMGTTFGLRDLNKSMSLSDYDPNLFKIQQLLNTHGTINRVEGSLDERKQLAEKLENDETLRVAELLKTKEEQGATEKVKKAEQDLQQETSKKDRRQRQLDAEMSVDKAKEKIKEDNRHKSEIIARDKDLEEEKTKKQIEREMNKAWRDDESDERKRAREQKRTADSAIKQHFQNQEIEERKQQSEFEAQFQNPNLPDATPEKLTAYTNTTGDEQKETPEVKQEVEVPAVAVIKETKNDENLEEAEVPAVSEISEEQLTTLPQAETPVTEENKLEETVEEKPEVPVVGVVEEVKNDENLEKVEVPAEAAPTEAAPDKSGQLAQDFSDPNKIAPDNTYVDKLPEDKGVTDNTVIQDTSRIEGQLSMFDTVDTSKQREEIQLLIAKIQELDSTKVDGAQILEGFDSGADAAQIIEDLKNKLAEAEAQARQTAEELKVLSESSPEEEVTEKQPDKTEETTPEVPEQPESDREETAESAETATNQLSDATERLTQTLNDATAATDNFDNAVKKEQNEQGLPSKPVEPKTEPQLPLPQLPPPSQPPKPPKNEVPTESSADIQQHTQQTQQDTSATQEFTKSLVENAGALNEQAKQLQKSETSASGFGKIWSKVTGIISPQKLGNAGRALSMLTGLFNTATQTGQAAAGGIQAVSGALKLVQGFAGPVPDFMAIASGILSITNAIDLLIEDDAERLERLTKEAQQLSDQAKVAKADYNNLEKSTKKLDELKEKRYESAEAAEEYQTAVDELAEKFPEMISGFDDAGNIIINTTDAERVLTQAREKSANAAFEAAKAELKLTKDKLKTSSENIEGDRSYLSQTLIPDESGNGGISNLIDYARKEAQLQALETQLVDEKTYKEVTDYLYAGNVSYTNEKLMEKLEGIGITDIKLDERFNNQNVLSIENKFQELSERLAGITDFSSEEGVNLVAELKSAFNQAKDLGINIDDIYETFSDLITETSNYADLVALFNSYSSQTVYGWLGKTGRDKNYSTSTQAKSMVASAISNQHQDYVKSREDLDENYHFDFSDEENIRILDNFSQASASADVFFSHLNEQQLELFNKMAEDTKNYSAEDFSVFDNVIGYKDFYGHVLIPYYRDGITSIQERITENLKQTADVENVEDLSGFYKQLSEIQSNVKTTTEESYFNSIIAQYQALSKKGYTISAGKFSTAAINLFTNINELSGEIEKTIWASIAENGLNTVEGINSIIDSIKNNDAIKQDKKDGIIKELQTIQTTSISNVNLSIQSQIQEVLDTWNDTSKNLTKAMEKKLSLSEANDLIEQASSLGIDISTSDFTPMKDKMVLSAEKFSEFWIKLQEANRKNADDFQSKIDAATTYLQLLNNIDIDIIPPNDLESIKTTFDSLGVTWKDSYIDITGHLTEEASKIIQEAIKNSQDGLNNLIWDNETAAKQVAQAYDWSQGNYFGTANGDTSEVIYKSVVTNAQDLLEKIKADAEKHFSSKGTPEDIQLREMLDYIYESYDALISDVLSKGFDNIHIEDYTGLIQGIDIDLSGSYRQFVGRYIQYAGKSVDETNDLLLQAIQKDNETKSIDLIKDLEFFNETQFKTNLSGLNELAKKLDVPLDTILNDAVISYNEALDEYIVDATKIDNLDLSSTEFQNTIQNNIQDFFKTLASYISDALKGSLSADNARDLQKFATDNGIGELRFTRTADGLKVANDQMRALVSSARELDSIQGEILFNDLKDSLIESEDAFKSISSNTEYIYNLRKNITKDITSQAGLTQEQQKLLSSLNGNVDVFNRPVIQNADGTISTLKTITANSRNYESEIPWVMNITPITSDGKELSDTALDEYIDKLFKEAGGDLSKVLALDKTDLGLIIELADTAGKDQEKVLQQYDMRAESLHEISALIEEIKASDEFDTTKIDQYKEELRLAEEILAVRSTTEDDTFKFMDQKIPSGQNNPLNYWKNWTEAFEKMQETTKGKDKGTMAYEDFYNIVTEMGNIAKYTKDGINIGGQAVHNAEEASALIEQAAATLTTTSTGDLVVDLGKIGIDFSAGVDGMAKGVDAGIDAIADEQIKMLDSMIQLLETVVAMEELGKIDVDNDNILDLGEIFEVEYDPDDPDRILKVLDSYNTNFQTVASTILKNAEGNDDLTKALDQMKITSNGVTVTMREMLGDAQDVIRNIGLDYQSYQQVLQSFYSAYLSGDYSLDNIYESIKNVLSSTDFEGEIQVGDLHLKFAHNTVFELDENGNIKTSDGSTFKNDEHGMDEAVAHEQENSIINTYSGVKRDTETQQVTIGNKIQFNIEYESKTGVYTIHFDDGSFSTATSEEGIQLAIATYANLKGTTLDETTTTNASESTTWTYYKEGEIDIVLNLKDGQVTTTSGYDNTDQVVQNAQKAADARAEEVAKAAESTTIKTATNDIIVELNEGTSIKLNTSDVELSEPIPIVKADTTNLEVTPENINVTGIDEAKASLQKVLDVFEQLTDKNIIITVTDETAEALATLQTNLNDPNAGPVIKEVKARITEYINGEGENADPNKLVSNLQGILTTYESQIPEDQKTAIEGLIGIINQAQLSPEITKPEIQDLVANLTVEKDDTKTALENNAKTAQKGVQQDINIETNATGTALNDNINAEDVVQNIINISNEVISKIDDNVTYAKLHPIIQQILYSDGGGGSHGYVKGTVGGGGRNHYTSNLSLVNAQGNIANAKGTLMGELGPELVVQNGHYFVAGQDGAEFVDLMDDAIVFNHLQTQQLLKNGMSNSRGRALTNERVAASYAHGNVSGGPAMASASAALNALKQLRAMWKSLQDMSSKDLLGAGGGGGGGGGGKDDMASFLKDLERWYNWLQRIAQLETEINYQEQLRSKIESDMVAHGQDYFNSQLVSLGKIEDQIAVRQDLLNSQQEYFNARREELNTKSPFSSLYTFDETGQLKYREGAFNTLSEILSADEYGQPKYTTEEQYNKLLNLNPDFANYMKYDKEGKEIKWTDDQGNPNPDAYTTAVEAFWEKVDADKEEMQSLHDSIEELKVNILENFEAINEILHNIEENQIDVENMVLKAIEDSRQREIDELQDTRDAIEDSNSKLIQGLQDQLDNEQKMYEAQASSEDLTKLQRQLAILQRSGASAADISNLQNQITDKQSDMYFDAQERQIDAIQQASDAQLERLDAQIDLMTETLAYEKENGLLWKDVYDQMLNKTPEEIESFIREHDSSLWGESPTEQIKTDRENIFKLQRWVEFSDKFSGLQDLIDHFTKPEVGTETLNKEAQAAADAINGITTKNASEDAQAKEPAVLPDNSTTSNTDNQNVHDTTSVHTTKQTKGYKSTWKYVDPMDRSTKVVYGYGESALWAEKYAQQKIPQNALDRYKVGTVQYEYGGIVKNDGEGYLHADEGVLTPEQTSTLRNEILGNKPNSLLSLLMTWRDSVMGLADTSSISNYNSGINIEKAEVIMQVSHMSNDYDAQRAGEQALDKIMSIARKTMAQNRIGR